MAKQFRVKELILDGQSITVDTGVTDAFLRKDGVFAAPTGFVNSGEFSNATGNFYTKGEVDNLFNFSEPFYFTAQDSDYNGYKLMRKAYPTGQPITGVQTITSSNQLITGFITRTGALVDSTVEGLNSVYIKAYTSASNSKNVALYYKLSALKQNSSLEPIATSISSEYFTTTNQTYIFNTLITGYNLLSTDRLVLEFFSELNGGGANPTLNFTFGGITAARESLPYNSESITNSFYLNSNPRNFISSGDIGNNFVNLTGEQDIQGDKKFNGTVRTANLSAGMGNDFNVFEVTDDPFIYARWPNGNFFLDTEQGEIVSKNALRRIYLDETNPIALAGDWTIDNTGIGYYDIMNFGRVSGISGSLRSHIDNNITAIYGLGANLQGQINDKYSNTNPDGYITSSSLAPYATQVQLTGASGHLQSQVNEINSWSGSVATYTQLTGASGSLQTQVNSNVTVLNNLKSFAINYIIDGGNQTILTGFKGYVEVPFSGTITGWSLLGNASGNLVTNVHKNTFSSFNPSGGTSIVGSQKPTLSNTLKSGLVNPSTWITGLSANDLLVFSVESVSGINLATISIRGVR